MDQLLWALVRQIERELGAEEAELNPMPSARHLLLGYWFGPRCRRGGDAIRPIRPRQAHSVSTRLRAELLLHLAKCKGMVNLSASSPSTPTQA